MDFILLRIIGALQTNPWATTFFLLLLAVPLSPIE